MHFFYSNVFSFSNKQVIVTRRSSNEASEFSSSFHGLLHHFYDGNSPITTPESAHGFVRSFCFENAKVKSVLHGNTVDMVVRSFVPACGSTGFAVDEDVEILE